jgi:hypothetical protein
MVDLIIKQKEIDDAIESLSLMPLRRSIYGLHSSIRKHLALSERRLRETAEAISNFSGELLGMIGRS